MNHNYLFARTKNNIIALFKASLLKSNHFKGYRFVAIKIDIELPIDISFPK